MSVERLHELRAILRQSSPLSADLAAWLEAGVDSYLKGLTDTLDDALDLTRAARTARAIEQRNTHLRRAWALLDGSDRARARELALTIRRITSSTGANPRTELAMAIKSAWDSWPLMPDARQLVRIALCDIGEDSNVTRNASES